MNLKFKSEECVGPYFSLATFSNANIQSSKQHNISGSYGSKYFPHDLAKNGTRRTLSSSIALFLMRTATRGSRLISIVGWEF